MMEGQAFTVLPPLSPHLPPPLPTPASTRVAPRTTTHKEASAFVILGEIKLPDGPPGVSSSGRVSPFRGSGFRAPSPPSSRIPVLAGKSATSSPVKTVEVNQNAVNNKNHAEKAKTNGKSLPSSPRKISSNAKQTNKTQLESPSKRAVKIPTLKEPTNNKRVTTKPPVPKSPLRNINNNKIINNGKQTTLKPPQPAKRTTVDDKPAPLARTRLKTKPLSTEVKSTAIAKPKLSSTKQQISPKVPTRNVLSKKEDVEVVEENPKESQTLAENISSERTEEPKVERKFVEVNDDDILNKVVTVTETIPEIHKLNIEVNNDGGDSGSNSITVVELITPDEDVQLLSSLKGVPPPPASKSPTESNGVLPVVFTEQQVTSSSAKVDKIKNGMSAIRAVRGGVAAVSSDSHVPSKPTDGVIEENVDTVEGLPDVEVAVGNHTVTFSSPEIQPVSSRADPKKKNPLGKRLKEGLCGCHRNKSVDLTDVGVTKVKGKSGPPSEETPPKWYVRLCRWKKKPPPSKLSKPMKAKGESLLTKLNCCKRKPKTKTHSTYPSPGSSRWRKIFCMDRAVFSKCCARKTAPAQPGRPSGASRLEMKRSSSIPTPPKPTGLPKLDAALVEHASAMKGAIPVLPICLAWTCLVLNIVIPGSGTVMSGFLCVCFGKPRFSVNDSGVARLGSLCVNFIVGISQLFTILFCLVGWGWSIWWGVIMIKVARKNRRIKLAEKATAAAGGAPAPTTANTTQDLEKGGS